MTNIPYGNLTDDEVWRIHAECFTDDERGHSDVATYDFAYALYKRGYEDGVAAASADAGRQQEVVPVVRYSPWVKGSGS